MDVHEETIMNFFLKMLAEGLSAICDIFQIRLNFTGEEGENEVDKSNH